MVDMKKTKKRISGDEDSQKKERHIVSWTQEEDDILREQISIHGTENWSIIASKFKDKTTRQCRRRWYTYLNSDFKKGGWSPEEDMLLCEAQRIFGNRWTEIAKVVSGRTDNAVKNRFSTLCKKKAKYEALAKENAASYINSNNKRVLLPNSINTSETLESAAPLKKLRRSHVPTIAENCYFGDKAHKPSGNTISQQLRYPFAVLGHNFHDINNLPTQNLLSITKEAPNDVQSNKIQGTYLKKDDPKVTALMQQAELLSSLAQKVNAENTDQSLENAWKVLQEFLNQTREGNVLQYKASDVDFHLENFKDLVEDLRSSNEGSHLSWRQPNLYESPSSSEYSTGSTVLPHTTGDKTEQTQSDVVLMNQGMGNELQPIHIEEKNVREYEKEIMSLDANQDFFPSLNEQAKSGVASVSSSAEFSSPLQVTSLFRSLAAGIPTPEFSESERHFLLKTLGMESPSANAITNPMPSPPCKRVLLHSL